MTYKPTWAQYEADIHGNDPKKAIEATEAFTQERDRELATSREARDYEKARREEMARNKPLYAKKKREEAEMQDPSKRLLADIRQGGRHKCGLNPSAGYVLVEVEKPSETNLGGLIISEDAVEPNTAVVLAVGGDQILEKNILPAPVKVGDRILFKKFAGMEIEIKGVKSRVLTFTDVLGVFTDD